MKILFFLLVTANVALFMWEYKQGAFSHTESQAIAGNSPDLESIVLAKEVDTSPSKEQSPAIENTQQASIPSPSNPNCYLAGPFSNEAMLQSWSKQAGLHDMKLVNKDDQQAIAYLVYYPAEDTMEKSKKNMQMLRNHGITDLWIFTQGEQQGEISLGLFTKEDKALVMKTELLGKGVQAKIKPKYKTKPLQYVEFIADGKLLETLSLLKSSYPKVEIEPIGQCSNP